MASKLGQVEEGVPVADGMREVTSFEHTEGQVYSAVIDPATATLRIRQRICSCGIGALAWDFVKALDLRLASCICSGGFSQVF